MLTSRPNFPRWIVYHFLLSMGAPRLRARRLRCYTTKMCIHFSRLPYQEKYYRSWSGEVPEPPLEAQQYQNASCRLFPRPELPPMKRSSRRNFNLHLLLLQKGVKWNPIASTAYTQTFFVKRTRPLVVRMMKNIEKMPWKLNALSDMVPIVLKAVSVRLS